MKSLNKINPDFLVLGAAALIITLCSVLLYADFTMRGGSGDEERIGSITFKRRVAQRKYAAEVIWEDLEQKATVFNNDSIRTSDLSEAVIELDDGTIIGLDENSLILLALSRDGVTIDFSRGTISAQRASLAEGDAIELSIRSSEAVVSIDKADVKLSRAGDEALDVTVTGGTAEVTSGGTSKTIGDDERAVVTAGEEARVVRRSLKAVAPAPLATVVTAEAAVTVDFKWEALEGEENPVLEIARDRNFTRPRRIPAPGSGSLGVTLAEGDYYWRFRGTGGGKGEYSDARRLSVLRDRQVRLLAPEKGQTVTYVDATPVIAFRWQGSRFANEYRVDLSRNGTTERTFTTPLREISMDGLGEGSYTWRVTPLNEAFASYEKSGAESSFMIARTEKTRPPELLFPPDRYKAGSGILGGEREFIFSWSDDARAQTYRFMIARDPGFTDMAVSSSVNRNYYPMSDSLPPGRYYWRVAPIGEGGVRTFSKPRTITILSTVTVAPGLPLVKAVRDGGDGAVTASVWFPWRVEGFSGDRRLEVARDAGFLDMAAMRKTGEDEAVVEDLPPGVYYWRVRLLGDERALVGETPPLPLYLSTAGAIVGSADEILPRKTAAEIAAERAEEERLRKESQRVKREEDLARRREAEVARKRELEEAQKREAEIARKRDLEEGEKREAELARKRASGEGTPVLQIVSSVKGSAIYINSRLKGYGSVTLSPPAGERLLVEVKADHYEDYSESLTLSPGEKRRVQVRLISTVPQYREKKPGRRLRWRTRLASPVMSRPVYARNIIVAAAQNGQVVGLDPGGRTLWRTALGSDARSTPAVEGSSIYVVTVRGQLVSLDISTGRIRWKKDVAGPLLFGAGPVVEKGRIYLATSYGTVQAYSDDGKELWRRDLEEGIFSSMASDGGLLFVGTDRSRIHAIRKESGEVKWSFTTDSRIFTSSPVVSGGILFVGCYKGSFYALSARSGRLQWVYRAGGAILSSPAFSGDSVYVGSEDGVLHALKIRTGKKAWEFRTGSSIVAGPDVSRGALLVPSGTAIYSLDAGSGELNWKEGLRSGITTTVTVAGDAAYVGLASGEIVSLSSF
ncbi:MAG: PQQ-binding-like beta-propeller repeat protein [Spirochaetes bacterium]|nr:PQQ-binding-like beta-propeller repeat protein [Spirochaetota bacterium]